MAFNYYYGNQADQFSFVRIPKLMLKDKRFADLSLAAKMLYGLLLDGQAGGTAGDGASGQTAEEIEEANRWFESL